jgi:hypothetical protein
VSILDGGTALRLLSKLSDNLRQEAEEGAMAENRRAVGSVTYQDAEHGYFERRKLRRHVAFWSLWR